MGGGVRRKGGAKRAQVRRRARKTRAPARSPSTKSRSASPPARKGTAKAVLTPSEELLALEKKRRGLAPSKLLFLGVHNLAQYHWCAMYAVLKSRENEMVFFSAHLADRKWVASELGLDVPGERQLALEVLGSISWSQAEPVLLPPTPVTLREQPARRDVARLLDKEVAPLQRGRIAESMLAEQHPRARWSFEVAPYVVVGIPDGIERTFVYEFKQTSSDYLARFQWPVARAQGDIYGMLFGRSVKRLDVFVSSTGERKVEDLPVDEMAARATLRKFSAVDEGGSAIPPMAFKCSRCEFNVRCPVRRDQ